MPSESSTSVEVTYLDNASAVAALRAAARALVDRDANVLRIYLFGSLAAGTATPESDADLLVIVRGAEGRFFERGDAFRECFAGAAVGVGVEVFVYAEAELERMRAAGNDFIINALAGATLLAERK